MEKKIQQENFNDEKLRQLLLKSRLKADSNLKHRIMQQIQTENDLRKTVLKKEKKFNGIIGNLLTTFVVSYTMIIGVVLLFISKEGVEAIRMPEFYLSLVFIAATGSTFGFISYFDDKLKLKSGKEKKSTFLPNKYFRSKP